MKRRTFKQMILDQSAVSSFVDDLVELCYMPEILGQGMLRSPRHTGSTLFRFEASHGPVCLK
jgi:hypothetical protein